MKKLLLISFVVGILGTASAQNYRTAVGIKGDYSTLDIASADFTVKHFFAGSNAFELNAGGGKRHIWAQLYYQNNQYITRGLDWYWGAGPDFGYWKKGVNQRGVVQYTEGFWGGVNGIIGLEYTLEHIPINLALDTGPTLRVYPDVLVGWNVGFALRYGFTY